jgi:hypothetical protein
MVEVGGQGVWACVVIVAVGGGAFVCWVISSAAQGEGQLEAFSTSVTIWGDVGPAVEVVWVRGSSADWPAAAQAFLHTVGVGPAEVARVSPGVLSFLASSPGTCAAMYPPFLQRFRPIQ